MFAFYTVESLIVIAVNFTSFTLFSKVRSCEIKCPYNLMEHGI